MEFSNQFLVTISAILPDWSPYQNMFTYFKTQKSTHLNWFSPPSDNKTENWDQWTTSFMGCHLDTRDTTTRAPSVAMEINGSLLSWRSICPVFWRALIFVNTVFVYYPGCMIVIELSFLSVRSFLSVAAFHNSVSRSSDFWYFRKWEDTLIPGTCRQCDLFICLPGTLFIAGTVPAL